MRENNIREVKKEKSDKKFSFKYIVWLIAMAFLVTSVVVLTKVVKMNILPTKFLVVAIGVVVLIIYSIY